MAQLMAKQMGWSLCIATLNRQAVLLRTLDYAARQTRPPQQVVVVDVSDNWQETAKMAADQLADHPDIELTYITSDVRSSATQRNLGLKKCTQDIVFMIDDDSFMFPNCAEEILKVYEADTEQAVSSVCARLALKLPSDVVESPDFERKSSGMRKQGSLRKRVSRSKLGRRLHRELLFQSKDELFLKYDEPRDKSIPATIEHLDVTPKSFMPGSAMTVRRDIALREPFDPSLRYYAAFEDLDAAYRYARHGAVIRANRARIHHFEIVGGRVKRKKVIIFQLLNMLVFLKRHAANPDAWVKPYRSMLRRRLLGEILKDGLSGRYDFPQAKGVWVVMRQWRNVWAKDVSELDDWYPGFQKTILEDL